MEDRFAEARYAIEQARESLQLGDRSSARRYAEHAATLTPQSEEPWLILAALSSPRSSVAYFQKALDLNPNSSRALKGMEWAMRRLEESEGAGEMSNKGNQPRGQKRSGKGLRRGLFFAILLSGLGCVVLAFAAWSASMSPALASFFRGEAKEEAVVVQHPQSWAQAQIPKPTYTPMSVSVVESPVFVDASTPIVAAETQPTAVVESQPIAPTEALPTIMAEIVQPTNAPIFEAPPVEFPTPLPANTNPPDVAQGSGSISVEIVQDTPTPEYAAVATNAPSSSGSSNGGGRWIDVDLSQQRVYAYEGDTAVNSFIVSTGTWQTPTVTGKFKIWIKLRSTDMAGPGYYLPDVPYVMYFYKGYGLHGTYWHNNFGTPMSHGCVNLSIPDAEWLYNFAWEGMTVNVHY